MLWPVILPLKITLCSWAGVLFILTAAAPIVRLKRRVVFQIVSLVAIVGFIPSCGGVMAVLNSHRFGVFHYGTFEEVGDWRVQRYLPTAATDITVNKYAQGFRARFRISEKELAACLDEDWRKYGDRSATQRSESSPST